MKNLSLIFAIFMIVKSCTIPPAKPDNRPRLVIKEGATKVIWLQEYTNQNKPDWFVITIISDSSISLTKKDFPEIELVQALKTDLPIKLEVGFYKAVIKAGNSAGETSSDTLLVEVVK